MTPKPFLTFALISAFAFSFLSCQHLPERYSFQGNKAIELAHDADSLAVYGVFSDIHGETEKLETLAALMVDRGVEGFIILGDTPQNEVLRSGGRRTERKDDTKEMIEADTILAKTELPVFILPGNHERKPEYETAMKEVKKKYKNIIDLTQYRMVDGDDVDFVSLPGYQIRQTATQKFIPDNGYFVDVGMITATGKLTRGLDDTVILLTHGPPKTSPTNSSSLSDATFLSNPTSPYLGPGTLFSGEDVGDEATKKMMQEREIHFALSGHLHEAGGIATTLEGNAVPAGQWAEEMVLNVGSLEEWVLLDKSKSKGMAAIVSIDGKRVKYEMILLK